MLIPSSLRLASIFLSYLGQFHISPSMLFHAAVPMSSFTPFLSKHATRLRDVFPARYGTYMSLKSVKYWFQRRCLLLGKF